MSKSLKEALDALPMPEPVNKGQSLTGGVERPWEPLFPVKQLCTARHEGARLALERAIAQAKCFSAYEALNCVQALRAQLKELE